MIQASMIRSRRKSFSSKSQTLTRLCIPTGKPLPLRTLPVPETVPCHPKGDQIPHVAAQSAELASSQRFFAGLCVQDDAEYPTGLDVSYTALGTIMAADR